MDRTIRLTRTATLGRKAWLAGSTALALAVATGAYALPTGGEVAAGQAGVSTAGGTMTVNQATQNVAINWQTFGIGQSETVRFVQPNSQSVALNRVLGSDPSNILGALSANGRVFLINPNGVLFGAGSQVNVGGLVASTLNITDADVMAGRYVFSGAGGTVLNQGAITAADGGFVALLGGEVSNNGVIQARLGSVALAAGAAMTLDFKGDGLLNVSIDRGAAAALVQNGGLIQADGGSVLLTAKGAGGLVRTAVNNTGVIEARTLESRGGRIVLLGDMATGDTNVGGVLDASAPDGGDGGFIETSAARVHIADDARVTTLAADGKTGLWLLDPFDYLIAAAGDETPASVIASLLLSNRQIQADHDITVADAITWGTPRTLELTAGNNININAAITATAAGARLVLNAGNNVNTGAAITASAAGSQVLMTAGNNVNIGAAVTASAANTLLQFRANNNVTIGGALTATGGGALIDLSAGLNVIQSAAITSSGGGALLFTADNDGTGGVGGGTVILNAPAALTSDSLTIFYSPENGYAAPNNYAAVTPGVPVVDANMWVFATAADKIYDGTTAATLGFVGDPTVGGSIDVALAGGAQFFDRNVGPTKAVNIGGAALSGAAANQFALFSGGGGVTAAITAAPLTVTAGSTGKTFGQVLTLPTTAFTATGLVAGETIGGVTLVSAGLTAGATVAGGPYAITPSNAVGGSFSAGNYSITYINGLLTVAPQSLIITANDLSKVYGELLTLPSTGFTATGLLNGDTVGGVTLVSAGAAPGASVGASPYAITPSSAVGGTFVASNYTLVYVNGLLTVAPAVVTVTGNSVTKAYGQSVVFSGQEFSVSGLRNGETIGAVVLASSGAAPGANVAAAPYAIATSGASGGTFAAANYTLVYVNGALTVTPAVLVVTPNSVTKPYGQAVTFTGQEFTTAGLQNGQTIGAVTLSSAGAAATAAVAGTPYAITAANAVGGTYTPANYVITYAAGAITVTPAPLVITANDVSKPFLSPLTFNGTEFTSAGLRNGETIASVLLTSAGAAGTALPTSTPYPITPSNASGGTFSVSNYAITYVAGGLSVNAPQAAVDIGGATVAQLGGRDFAPVGLSNGPSVTSATEVSEAERRRRAGDENGLGFAAPVAGPQGVQLAVMGDGVRMPAFQVAEIQQAHSLAEQQVQPAATETAPAQTQPVRAPKQGRN
ncbi:MBG domain-containing protein [Phenylobacterium sp.]|jgi:filamentous hemagglutinin family protein|uniref:MBG domain-containing protein n=1 Tax=Phenylobacterium sp. TaxID=1871053 RepID=UPI002F9313E1